MSTKELKIEVPQGYEIDRENSTFENIVFKKVENELPKSWEDLYEVGGWFVDFHSKVVTSGSMRTADSVKNRFPTKEEAEACIALAQLCQLRDRYNDGWKPNWEDGDEQKYVIKIGRGETTKCILTVTSSVLSFKSAYLRDKFLENFRDLIETAKPLL